MDSQSAKERRKARPGLAPLVQEGNTRDAGACEGNGKSGVS